MEKLKTIIKKKILKYLVILLVLIISFFIFFKQVFFQYLFKSKAAGSVAVAFVGDNNITFKQNEEKVISLTLNASEGRISGIDLKFKLSNEVIKYQNFSTTPNNYFNDLLIQNQTNGKLRIVAIAKKSENELLSALTVNLTFKAEKTTGVGTITFNKNNSQIVGTGGSPYGISADTDKSRDYQVSNQGYCQVNSDCGSNASCSNNNCVCNSNRYNCDNNWNNGCESSVLCSQITLTNNPIPISPLTGNVSLNLTLRSQGITKKPQDSKMSFKVKLRKEGTTEIKESTVVFEANDSGKWLGKVNFNINNLTGKWIVFIKGQFHIQKKICDANPTEQKVGLYHCDVGKITFQAGENSFDFSNITLLVGDLDGNGVVDSVDYGLVKNNLGKKDSEILKKADLNKDGVVDTQDFSLILYALSVKTDEM